MSETAPATEPSLRWRPYRDAITDEIVDAEMIGDLYDEDVRVGHARLLEHGPPNIEQDKARVWNWSVFPHPGFWRGHTVEAGGRDGRRRKRRPRRKLLIGASAPSPARGTRT